MRGLGILAGMMCLAVAQSPAEAQPIGLCGFDRNALSFAGDDKAQAACLLRPVRQYGHVGAERPLPPTLASLVGTPAGFPREALRAVLQGSSDPGERALADGLGRPVSRARDNQSGAPIARYFVIHDTSTPNLGAVAAFPADIDSSDHVNRFSRYPTDGRAKAHFFVNRRGEVRLFQDFSVPWRATKLELDEVGQPAKGLFVHIELIQPRRNDRRGIDAFAPDPGFTSGQYDRLAALYAVASRRAGRWLIPAFHGLVDAGIDGGHDDPQNFDLAKFDAALAALVSRLASSGSAAAPATASDALPPLRASLYYTALQSDYPAGSDAAFRTRDDRIISRASAEFVRKAEIEGSAKLSDGRLINVDGHAGGVRRWKVVSPAYGLDAVGCGLVPFRSAAVDRNVVPLRTRLHVPETVGMALPDGTRHDGIWYAVDTGSAITSDRIDLFVGAGRASMAVPRQHGIRHLQPLRVEARGGLTGCTPA